MNDRVGIIGVGHFAEYLVAGLRRDSNQTDILLSPRNRQRAQSLSSRFSARIASDNTQIVSECDLVVLATRPAQAFAAVKGLPWRAGQTLICVAAGLALAPLAAAVSPAMATLAMPLSCAVIGESPSALYPGGKDAEAFFARLGSVHVLPDAESFRAASVLGAAYGWLHAIMGETADWMGRHGVPAGMARELSARTLRGAAGMILEHRDQDLADMLRSLATPGGITEAGLERLAAGDVLEHWARACDAAHEKMRATSVNDDA